MGNSILKISACASACIILAACSAVETGTASARLKKNGYDWYPAEAGAKPYSASLGKIPTGAKEFEVLQPSNSKGSTVNAADFGLNGDIENSATVINKALEHCKKIGAAKLVVNKGTYKFFDAVSITLDGFKDFAFDASGSTFVFRSESAKQAVPQWSKSFAGSNCNIKIANCERVKVANVNFDWDWNADPLGGWGKAVEVRAEKENSYADFEFWQYEKYPHYGKATPVLTISAFDDNLETFYPARKGAWIGAPPPILTGEGAKGPKTQWISPNRIRVFLPESAAKNFVLGGKYRVLHYYYGKDCIKMISNRHLTIENVNIYSCRGHALFVDGEQQYWQYINVRIDPQKDPRRCVTNSADHHHFANSKGFMKILNCRFSMGQDDGGNFHDRSFAMRRADDYTLESANLRGLDFFDVKIGDEIILRNDDYSPTGFKAKIASIGRRGDVDTVVFSEKLPPQKGEEFVCFNARFDTRNIIIRNSEFVRHGCRGLLILARDVTIENCLFEKEQMGSIKLETGYTLNSWCEGYGVDNVVVRNCTFKKTNLSGKASQGFIRDIMLAAYVKTDPSDRQPSFPVITNVLFENNRFFDTSGLVAVISASENVIFRNNNIQNDAFFPYDAWYRGGFYVQYSKNVKIVNNVFADSPYNLLKGVIAKSGTVENLVVEGNISR